MNTEPREAALNHRYDYWCSTASNNSLQLAFDPGDLTVLEEFTVVPRELATLPPRSLFLSFTFTLASPYLSKDDRKPVPKRSRAQDNPIKREWAFRVPMVSATTWKGNLREAARILVEDPRNKAFWERRLPMLLGPEKPKDDEDTHPMHQGRLKFFPSYFGKVEDDILNPRQRTTRTGTTLINLEQVPPLQSARFAVLYAPFDLLWMEPSQSARQRELDLTLVGTALASMLVEFGFGAKKTLGLGQALPDLAGVVLQNDNGAMQLDSKSVNDLPHLAQWETP